MSTVSHSGVGCGSDSPGAGGGGGGGVERGRENGGWGGGRGERERGWGVVVVVVAVSGQRIAVLLCRKRGVANPISLTHVNNCRPMRVTSDPRPCPVPHSDHRHCGLTSAHMVTKIKN